MPDALGRPDRLRTSRSALEFRVDGKVVLTAKDDTLSWGTTGIRTDHVDAHIDEWRLLY